MGREQDNAQEEAVVLTERPGYRFNSFAKFHFITFNATELNTHVMQPKYHRLFMYQGWTVQTTMSEKKQGSFTNRN